MGQDGSGTIVADIFHEVDEEVRREQLKKLWDRYSIYLIALAVLIVAGMAGWRGYEYWVAKKAAAAGAEFEAAITLNEEGKRAEAEAAFAKVAAEAPAGYRTPLFPWTPALFLTSIVVVLLLLAAGRPREVALGISVVALGVPVYRLTVRKVPA